MARPPTPSGDLPSFQPLYGQIKTLILQRMQAGEWQPGDMIPSEIELAARFGVSQGTVRKAVDALAAENHVVRRQGKGTFVATHTEQAAQYRFLRLMPDLGERAAQGPTQRRVLVCERQRASAEVARALDLRAGETVVHARRVLLLAGVPTIIEDAWLAGPAFRTLTAAQLESYPGSSYALYEAECGVRMLRAQERIKAVAADDESAGLLQVAPGTPLLWIERIAHTFNDAPMELRHALYRTDAHHYQNQLN
jgi:GntR family transcriptional regulator